jgi:hypothetical protein
MRHVILAFDTGLRQVSDVRIVLILGYRAESLFRVYS